MKRQLWNTATMFWVSPEECDIYLRESPPIQTLTQFFSCSKQHENAENWIYLGLIEVDKELRFLMRYNYPQKSLFMNHNVDWGLLNIYGMSVSVERKKDIWLLGLLLCPPVPDKAIFVKGARPAVSLSLPKTFHNKKHPYHVTLSWPLIFISFNVSI